MLVVWLLLLLLVGRVAACSYDFRCRGCGTLLSHLDDYIDEEADDSEGRVFYKTVTQGIDLYYDTFPEVVRVFDFCVTVERARAY